MAIFHAEPHPTPSLAPQTGENVLLITQGEQKRTKCKVLSRFLLLLRRAPGRPGQAQVRPDGRLADLMIFLVSLPPPPPPPPPNLA